jgi:oligoribonuclease
MTICKCGHEDINHTLENHSNPSHRICEVNTCVCIGFTPQNSLLDLDRSKDIHGSSTIPQRHIPRNETFDYLFFLDYETTGEPDRRLLEVAWMLTDRNLIVLLPCQSLVIRQPTFNMTEVILKMHTRNGLLNEVARATTTTSDVEQKILQSIEPAILSDNRFTLTGFSCHYDRELMRRDMPILDKRLHYRHFDISVLRSAYHFWVEPIPSKKDEHPHRAKDDVLASWEIAKTFKTMFNTYIPTLENIPKDTLI